MTYYNNSLIGIIFFPYASYRFVYAYANIHTQLSKKSITLLPPAYKNVNAAHRTAWKTDKNIFTARLVSFDCLSNDFVFICTKWQWRWRRREIKKILNQTNECGDVRRLGRKKSIYCRAFILAGASRSRFFFRNKPLKPRTDGKYYFSFFISKSPRFVEIGFSFMHAMNTQKYIYIYIIQYK